MPARKFIFPILLVFPNSAQAYSDLEQMIISELRCVRLPQSTGILRALVEARKIDPLYNIGYDSLSCWKISGGIAVAGMTFQSVCAFEEDETIRVLNDDLYYRGPGTSPGQWLSFGASVSGDELSTWYIKVFGAALVREAISEGKNTKLNERSEVGCSIWVNP